MKYDPRLLPMHVWFQARVREDAPQRIRDLFRIHSWVSIIRVPSAIPSPRYKLGRFIVWGSQHQKLTSASINDILGSFDIQGERDQRGQNTLNELAGPYLQRRVAMSESIKEITARFSGKKPETREAAPLEQTHYVDWEIHTDPYATVDVIKKAIAGQIKAYAVVGKGRSAAYYFFNKMLTMEEFNTWYEEEMGEPPLDSVEIKKI